jgi:hypothetical protein
MQAKRVTDSALTPRGPWYLTARRPLQALLLLAVAATLAIGVGRAWDAARAIQRLHGAVATPSRPNVASIQEWMPLGGISRRFGVPESTLVHELRDAGFVVEGSPAQFGVPGAVQRWLWSVQERLTGSAPSTPVGGGDARNSAQSGYSRQSLRQIARASGDDPARAVGVVRETIRRQSSSPPAGVTQTRQSAVSVGTNRTDERVADLRASSMWHAAERP